MVMLMKKTQEVDDNIQGEVHVKTSSGANPGGFIT
jgi:hypothetical protein